MPTKVVAKVVSATVRWMSSRVTRFIIAARAGSLAVCSSAMAMPKAMIGQ